MLNVSNRKAIRKLSLKTFLSNKTRNRIAMIAIALTTILFTSVFTIAISMNYSWQQQTMRMVGGYGHGGFKYLNEEQLDKLKNHPLIKEYGATWMLSMPENAPFNKYHVEIRYGNDSGAKMYYSYPTTGHMPKEKMELATDTAVLDLLGIPHEIGREVTLTFPMGKETVTETFTLSGFWETDEAIKTSQVWLSKEYVRETLDKYPDSDYAYDLIGTWNLDIMFVNSKNIEKNLWTVADDYGFTIEDKNNENYLDTGINWAYTSTHLNNSDQIITILSLAVVGLLIIFTGYLIIYNIFHISIANDIRFYGLLKTIGTTGRQIRRIIRNQALILSVIGIPIGLIVGFLLGNSLTKVIMSTMINTNTYITMNPWIFIGSALFTVFTVLLSCYKPGKMAARVSPIEAVRYVDNNNIKKTIKKTKGGAKIYHMAMANVMRNRKKTILVILSLSLSVVLLNSTYSFTKGFDMDKYLNKFVVTDFIIGHADYFKYQFRNEDQKVKETLINSVEKQKGIVETGKVYNYTKLVQVDLTREELMKFYGDWSEEYIDPSIKAMQQGETKEQFIDLYGLDDLPMNYITTVEGDFNVEKMKTSRSIAQIVNTDDYGKPEVEEALYDIGDTITVHYYTDYDYDEEGNIIKGIGKDIEYKIVATVTMPSNMSLRHYGSPQFILSSDTMLQDAQEGASTMIFMANAEKEYRNEIENFIKDYTSNIESDMNYESKASYTKEFTSFQGMFLLVGGALSLIIGIVGILNFVNSEITSIMARRRELAMLQSIGMTGKQLNKMLILEGVFYGIAAIIVAFFISTGIGYFALKPMEHLLWFFSYRYTIVPILCIIPVFLFFGILIPYLTYKMANRQSIVERLRMIE